MSRSEVQSDLLVPGSAALAEFSTLRLADATQYDPNTLKTGVWADSSGVLSVPLLSQATVRDGFNEGARLHWALPSSMALDGTQGLEIVVDQISQALSSGKFTLSAGVVAIPTEATATGVMMGAVAIASLFQPIYLTATGIGATSPSSSGTLYSSMRMLWIPDVTGATLYHGGHHCKYRRSSGQPFNYAADFQAALTAAQARIVLHVGTYTAPTAGVAQTLAARVRVRPVTLWSAADAAL